MSTRSNVLLGAALAFTWASAARAGEFAVSPVRLELGHGVSSALLTIRNRSNETTRFQVTAHAWSQNPDGSMRLSATADIIVFPSLLELAPGGSRIIRIGARVPATDRERSYRIFIEELPPLRSTERPAPGVRVLTRMGVPIFLAPARPIVAGAIEAIRAEAAHLSFRVRNTGTVHVMLEKARVTSRNAKGDVISVRELPGWYLLAGETREYALDIPRGASITIEAPSDRGSWRADLRF